MEKLLNSDKPAIVQREANHVHSTETVNSAEPFKKDENMEKAPNNKSESTTCDYELLDELVKRINSSEEFDPSDESMPKLQNSSIEELNLFQKQRLFNKADELLLTTLKSVLKDDMETQDPSIRHFINSEPEIEPDDESKDVFQKVEAIVEEQKEVTEPDKNAVHLFEKADQLLQNQINPVYNNLGFNSTHNDSTQTKSSTLPVLSIKTIISTITPHNETKPGLTTKINVPPTTKKPSFKELDTCEFCPNDEIDSNTTAQKPDIRRNNRDVSNFLHKEVNHSKNFFRGRRKKREGTRSTKMWERFKWGFPRRSKGTSEATETSSSTEKPKKKLLNTIKMSDINEMKKPTTQKAEKNFIKSNSDEKFLEGLLVLENKQKNDTQCELCDEESTYKTAGSTEIVSELEPKTAHETTNKHFEIMKQTSSAESDKIHFSTTTFKNFTDNGQILTKLESDLYTSQTYELDDLKTESTKNILEKSSTMHLGKANKTEKVENYENGESLSSTPQNIFSATTDISKHVSENITEISKEKELDTKAEMTELEKEVIEKTSRSTLLFYNKTGYDLISSFTKSKSKYLLTPLIFATSESRSDTLFQSDAELFFEKNTTLVPEFLRQTKPTEWFTVELEKSPKSFMKLEHISTTGRDIVLPKIYEVSSEIIADQESSAWYTVELEKSPKYEEPMYTRIVIEDKEYDEDENVISVLEKNIISTVNKTEGDVLATKHENISERNTSFSSVTDTTRFYISTENKIQIPDTEEPDTTEESKVENTQSILFLETKTTLAQLKETSPFGIDEKLETTSEKDENFEKDMLSPQTESSEKVTQESVFHLEEDAEINSSKSKEITKSFFVTHRLKSTEQRAMVSEVEEVGSEKITENHIPETTVREKTQSAISDQETSFRDIQKETGITKAETDFGLFSQGSVSQNEIEDREGSTTEGYFSQKTTFREETEKISILSDIEKSAITKTETETNSPQKEIYKEEEKEITQSEITINHTSIKSTTSEVGTKNKSKNEEGILFSEAEGKTLKISQKTQKTLSDQEETGTEYSTFQKTTLQKEKEKEQGDTFFELQPTIVTYKETQISSFYDDTKMEQGSLLPEVDAKTSETKEVQVTMFDKETTLFKEIEKSSWFSETEEKTFQIKEGTRVPVIQLTTLFPEVEKTQSELKKLTKIFGKKTAPQEEFKLTSIDQHVSFPEPKSESVHDQVSFSQEIQKEQGSLLPELEKATSKIHETTEKESDAFSKSDTTTRIYEKTQISLSDHETLSQEKGPDIFHGKTDKKQADLFTQLETRTLETYEETRVSFSSEETEGQPDNFRSTVETEKITFDKVNIFEEGRKEETISLSSDEEVVTSQTTEESNVTLHEKEFTPGKNLEDILSRDERLKETNTSSEETGEKQSHVLSELETTTLQTFEETQISYFHEKTVSREETVKNQYTVRDTQKSIFDQVTISGEQTETNKSTFLTKEKLATFKIDKEFTPREELEEQSSLLEKIQVVQQTTSQKETEYGHSDMYSKPDTTVKIYEETSFPEENTTLRKEAVNKSKTYSEETVEEESQSLFKIKTTTFESFEVSEIMSSQREQATLETAVDTQKSIFDQVTAFQQETEQKKSSFLPEEEVETSKTDEKSQVTLLSEEFTYQEDLREKQSSSSEKIQVKSETTPQELFIQQTTFQKETKHEQINTFSKPHTTGKFYEETQKRFFIEYTTAREEPVNKSKTYSEETEEKDNHSVSKIKTTTFESFEDTQISSSEREQATLEAEIDTQKSIFDQVTAFQPETKENKSSFLPDEDVATSKTDAKSQITLLDKEFTPQEDLEKEQSSSLKKIQDKSETPPQEVEQQTTFRKETEHEQMDMFSKSDKTGNFYEETQTSFSEEGPTPRKEAANKSTPYTEKSEEEKSRSLFKTENTMLQSFEETHISSSELEHATIKTAVNTQSISDQVTTSQQETKEKKSSFLPEEEVATSKTNEKSQVTLLDEDFEEEQSSSLKKIQDKSETPPQEVEQQTTFWKETEHEQIDMFSKSDKTGNFYEETQTSFSEEGPTPRKEAANKSTPYTEKSEEEKSHSLFKTETTMLQSFEETQISSSELEHATIKTAVNTQSISDQVTTSQQETKEKKSSFLPEEEVATSKTDEKSQVTLLDEDFEEEQSSSLKNIQVKSETPPQKIEQQTTFQKETEHKQIDIFFKPHTTGQFYEETQTSFSEEDITPREENVNKSKTYLEEKEEKESHSVFKIDTTTFESFEETQIMSSEREQATLEAEEDTQRSIFDQITASQEGAEEKKSSFLPNEEVTTFNVDGKLQITLLDKEFIPQEDLEKEQSISLEKIQVKSETPPQKFSVQQITSQKETEYEQSDTFSKPDTTGKFYEKTQISFSEENTTLQEEAVNQSKTYSKETEDAESHSLSKIETTTFESFEETQISSSKREQSTLETTVEENTEAKSKTHLKEHAITKMTSQEESDTEQSYVFSMLDTSVKIDEEIRISYSKEETSSLGKIEPIFSRDEIEKEQSKLLSELETKTLPTLKETQIFFGKETVTGEEIVKANSETAIDNISSKSQEIEKSSFDQFTVPQKESKEEKSSLLPEEVETISEINKRPDIIVKEEGHLLAHQEISTTPQTSKEKQIGVSEEEAVSREEKIEEQTLSTALETEPITFQERQGSIDNVTITKEETTESLLLLQKEKTTSETAEKSIKSLLSDEFGTTLKSSSAEVVIPEDMKNKLSTLSKDTTTSKIEKAESTPLVVQERKTLLMINERQERMTTTVDNSDFEDKTKIYPSSNELYFKEDQEFLCDWCLNITTSTPSWLHDTHFLTYSKKAEKDEEKGKDIISLEDSKYLYLSTFQHEEKEITKPLERETNLAKVESTIIVKSSESNKDQMMASKVTGEKEIKMYSTQDDSIFSKDILNKTIPKDLVVLTEEPMGNFTTLTPRTDFRIVTHFPLKEHSQIDKDLFTLTESFKFKLPTRESKPSESQEPIKIVDLTLHDEEVKLTTPNDVEKEESDFVKVYNQTSEPRSYFVTGKPHPDFLTFEEHEQSNNTTLLKSGRLDTHSMSEEPIVDFPDLDGTTPCEFCSKSSVVISKHKELLSTGSEKPHTTVQSKNHKKFQKTEQPNEEEFIDFTEKIKHSTPCEWCSNNILLNTGTDNAEINHLKAQQPEDISQAKHEVLKDVERKSTTEEREETTISLNIKELHDFLEEITEPENVLVNKTHTSTVHEGLAKIVVSSTGMEENQIIVDSQTKQTEKESLIKESEITEASQHFKGSTKAAIDNLESFMSTQEHEPIEVTAEKWITEQYQSETKSSSASEKHFKDKDTYTESKQETTIFKSHGPTEENEITTEVMKKEQQMKDGTNESTTILERTHYKEQETKEVASLSEGIEQIASSATTENAGTDLQRKSSGHMGSLSTEEQEMPTEETMEKEQETTEKEDIEQANIEEKNITNTKIYASEKSEVTEEVDKLTSKSNEMEQTVIGPVTLEKIKTDLSKEITEVHDAFSTEEHEFIEKTMSPENKIEKEEQIQAETRKNLSTPANPISELEETEEFTSVIRTIDTEKENVENITKFASTKSEATEEQEIAEVTSKVETMEHTVITTITENIETDLSKASTARSGTFSSKVQEIEKKTLSSEKIMEKEQQMTEETSETLSTLAKPISELEAIEQFTSGKISNTKEHNIEQIFSSSKSEATEEQEIQKQTIEYTVINIIKESVETDLSEGSTEENIIFFTEKYEIIEKTLSPEEATEKEQHKKEETNEKIENIQTFSSQKYLATDEHEIKESLLPHTNTESEESETSLEYVESSTKGSTKTTTKGEDFTEEVKEIMEESTLKDDSNMARKQSVKELSQKVTEKKITETTISTVEYIEESEKIRDTDDDLTISPDSTEIQETNEEADIENIDQSEEMETTSQLSKEFDEQKKNLSLETFTSTTELSTENGSVRDKQILTEISIFDEGYEMAKITESAINVSESFESKSPEEFSTSSAIFTDGRSKDILSNLTIEEVSNEIELKSTKSLVIIVNNSGNKIEKINNTMLEKLLNKSITDIDLEYIEFHNISHGTTEKNRSDLFIGMPVEKCDEKDFESNNNCLCNIQHYLHTISEKVKNKDDINSKTLYCYKFIRPKDGLLIQSKSKRLIRKIRSLLYLQNLENNHEVVEHSSLEELFQDDYKLDTSANNIYALPGSMLEIPCKRKADKILPEANDQIWIRRSFDTGKDEILPEKGNLLTIHHVTTNSSGNYSCSKEKDKDNPAKIYVHELEVITFPVYDIQMNIFYKINATCELSDADILYSYLPKIVGPLLCSNDESVCDVKVERPRCVNREDDTFYNVSVSARVKPDATFFNSLDPDECDINCKLKVFSNIVSLINRNGEAIEHIPVHSELPTSTASDFVPYFTNNMKSLVDTRPPKILVSCPAGFGLESKRQNVCVVCPKHTFSEDDEAFCKICSPGQYQPRSGSKLCIQCNSPVDDPTCLRMLYSDTKLFKIYVGMAFGILILIIIGFALWSSSSRDQPEPMKNAYIEGSLRHRATRNRKPTDRDLEGGVAQPLLGTSKKIIEETPPELPPVDF